MAVPETPSGSRVRAGVDVLYGLAAEGNWARLIRVIGLTDDCGSFVE